MKILKFIAYLMLFCIFCAVITTPPYNIIFIGVCILGAYWIFKNKKIEIKKEDTSIKPTPTQQQRKRKPVYANIYQITTIDKSKIVNPMNHLDPIKRIKAPDSVMDKIDKGIIEAFTQTKEKQ